MLKSKIKLRPEQKPIVEAIIKNKEGVVVASTGVGKTIIFTEVIARLGITTVILTPNTVLLQQWKNEIKKFLDYDVGIIGSGKKIIKDITVSTFQSLMIDKELCKKLASQCSMLIIDEAHGVATNKKLKIIGEFSPVRIYGMTATLNREDGKAPAVNFYLGETIYNYKSIQLKPTIKIIESKAEIPVTDYADMIQMLVEDDERNKIIARLAENEAENNRKILILTKRRQHAKLLYEKLINNVDNVFLIDSDNKKRNNLLAEFKNNTKDFSIIIGTTSLLAVGTDVPALDTLIMASDLKAETLTVQSMGRILRLFEGKQNPIIYDIYDKNNPILHRQARLRQQIYKKLEYKTINNTISS